MGSDIPVPYDFELPTVDVSPTSIQQLTLCTLQNQTHAQHACNETDYAYIYDFEDDGLAAELALVTIVYGLTLCLGIVGNGLVIFTIMRIRRMQSVTNVFLTSLASADLLLVLICVPIKYGKWFSFTWDFGWFLCKAVHYLQNMAVICSTLTLTAMSMERFYAICHPMQAKYKCTVRRTRKIIAVLWLLSILLALPILYGQIYKEVGNKYRSGHWCLPQWPSTTVEQVYELFMLCLILLFPLCVMIVAYTRICLALWAVGPSRAEYSLTKYTKRSSTNSPLGNTAKSLLTPAQNQGRNEVRKQVIKMLVTIIVLFTICWAPALVDNVLVAFEKVERLNYGHLKPMRQAFDVMSYMNSCVNPIVYAFMSKHWRLSFKLALCSCFNGNSSSRHSGTQNWNQNTQHMLSTTSGTALGNSSVCVNGQNTVTVNYNSEYTKKFCDATQL